MAWKLAALLKGQGGDPLIASYDLERIQAADENIGHSTRSTDFMSPHSSAERRLRDAVLALAPKAEFARRMINSGRLSVPIVYDTPLSTPDEAPFAGAAKLGASLPDARLRAKTVRRPIWWKTCAVKLSSFTSRTATARMAARCTSQMGSH